jgi:hypothetical protein
MSSIVPSGQERSPAPSVTPPPATPAAPVIFAQVGVDVYSLMQNPANALIIGNHLAVLRVLGIVWPSLKKSVRWVESARLSLPPESGGTLILEEGDRLGEHDQAVLLDWLNGHGRSVRVLTTSPRPLFPLVEAGSFLEPLYYRLNHVLITAS